MRTHFQRPARAALWIAGTFIGLFAVLGVAAIAPSVPAARDAMSGGDPPAAARAAADRTDDARTGAPEARAGAARVAAAASVRARCPECGVVESIRQIGRDGADDGAVAADDAAANGYEITVRLRDGSRTVFSEASPGTWRLGSRVLVIVRDVAAKD